MLLTEIHSKNEPSINIEDIVRNVSDIMEVIFLKISSCVQERRLKSLRQLLSQRRVLKQIDTFTQFAFRVYGVCMSLINSSGLGFPITLSLSTLRRL